MVLWSGEDFEKNLRSAAASPREREVYHTPVLQQHLFLFLVDIPNPKDESFLLRKFLISLERNKADTQIAKIDSNGVLTGLKDGVVTIFAEASNGC